MKLFQEEKMKHVKNKLRHAKKLVILVAVALISVTLAACGGGPGPGPDLPPLLVPTNVTVNTLGNTRTVTWTTSRDAASYAIYYRSATTEQPMVAFGDWAPTGLTAQQPASGMTQTLNFANTPFVNGLLRAPVQHWFAVRAIAGTGADATHSNSALSTGSAAFTIERTRLAQPKIVTTQANVEANLEIEWEAVDKDALGVEIPANVLTGYRITATRPGATLTREVGKDVLSTTLWSATPPADGLQLEPPHVYSVTVTALAQSGHATLMNSLASDAREVDLSGRGQLDAPVDLDQAVPSMDLTWEHVTGAEAYFIEVLGVPGASTVVTVQIDDAAEPPAPFPTQTFDLNEFRLPEGDYHVVVSARAKGMRSGFSLPFEITAAINDNAPRGLAVPAEPDIITGELMLTWTRGAGTGQTNQVQVRPADGSAPWENFGDPIAFAYLPRLNLLSLPLDGGLWEARVVATVVIETVATQFPSAPVPFTVVQKIASTPAITVDQATGLMTWTHVQDATHGYRLVINDAPVATTAQFGTQWYTSAGNQRSFNLNNLALDPDDYEIRLISLGEPEGIYIISDPSARVMFTSSEIATPANARIENGILRWTDSAFAFGGYALIVEGDFGTPVRTGLTWFQTGIGSARSFDLRTLALDEGDHDIQLVALSSNENLNSDPTAELVFESVALTAPVISINAAGTLQWTHNPLANAGYVLVVTNKADGTVVTAAGRTGLIWFTTGTGNARTFDLRTLGLAIGAYDIQLGALSTTATLNSSMSTPLTFSVVVAP